MTTIHAYPVLLAGGSGTRLWPVSREYYPKQLARFFGSASLIQNTVKRLSPVFDSEKIRIVCGERHAYEIGRDLDAMQISSEGKLIHEPCGRNTAPAILLALLHILKNEPDPVIFIFPADHVIADIEQFHRNILSANILAQEGYIVTFGITPKYPETGYGYIEASQAVVNDAFRIRRFVEKPDLKTAQSYVDAGNFFWNSGMFAFKASIMLRECERFKPKLLADMRRLAENSDDVLCCEAYEQLENISIDYAVMEPTDKGVVLPSDFGWSDIGSWKSLYDFLPKDEHQNVVAAGDVMLQNTHRCFVMGHERLIAVNHIENVVVVETPDSVFVSDMENSRDVKDIVSQLKKTGRSECQYHTTVYQPWGWRKLLENKDGQTVSRLVLYPGATVSDPSSGKLTHWFVISGNAQILLNDSLSTINETASAQIPKNASYRLTNTGQVDLHLIEVKISDS